MKAASHIGEIDMRHQSGVIAEPIKAETFAHIAVDHHRNCRNPIQRAALAPGDGMRTGLSAGTSLRRSRRAGMVR